MIQKDPEKSSLNTKFKEFLSGYNRTKRFRKKSIEIFRRDTLEKQFIKIEESLDFVSKLLDEIQKNLFNKAKNFRNNNITEVENFEDFKTT